MLDETLDKLFAPPSGSRHKFRSRLDSTIIQERQESTILKVVTGALAVVICFFVLTPPLDKPSALGEAASWLDIRSQPIIHGSTEISGNTIEYSRSAPGIRMYWVFR